MNHFDYPPPTRPAHRRPRTAIPELAKYPGPGNWLLRKYVFGHRFKCRIREDTKHILVMNATRKKYPPGAKANEVRPSRGAVSGKAPGIEPGKFALTCVLLGVLSPPPVPPPGFCFKRTAAEASLRQFSLAPTRQGGMVAWRALEYLGQGFFGFDIGALVDWAVATFADHAVDFLLMEKKEQLALLGNVKKNLDIVAPVA